MSARDPAERVPDLLVEQLHLGELPPDVAAAVRARLDAEPGGRARLDALAADDRSFDVPRRASPRPASRSPWRLLAPAIVAAFAAVLLVVRAPDPAGTDAPFGLRTKSVTGSRPALLVYRQVTSGPPELLADGATARPGDVLQIAYVAVGRRVGAILSLDGRGQTTTHLPAGALAQGGEVRLPAAFRLDDAPGFERFVLMTIAPDTGALEVTTLTVTKP
ncbi:MAG: hypothetical protein IT385_03475 [Deltaproteobacteria bacterium]|nr:hypothetical protein [Deltaproteobacteria bacterium]